MVKSFDRGNKAAGYLMRSELENLGFLLGRPPRPFVAIMGGAKVSDKLAVLHSLIERVDSLVIGGAMAYTFLKAQGHDVGASRVEADLIADATQILEKARAKQIAIYLPIDHVVAASLDAPTGTFTSGKEIPAGMMGLDIGPQTRDLYAGVIAAAAAVFWNGPMGVFEKAPFAEGTFQGVSCVFLMHELPGEARQNVINDCFRILEAGGVITLADSVQLADSPQFSTVMENFRRVFHEPYYRDYISDDIEARLKAAGFEAVVAESHFMTRVWTARKPQKPGQTR
jgi:SAM-dependent methyltransferase